MRNKLFATLSLGAGLWLAWADCGEAFFWKRHKPPCEGADYNEAETYPGPMLGGPVPEYGKVPGIVPNPYPWNFPNMFSGFRHYHMVPMMEPGLLEVVPTPPSDDKTEQAPLPRKTEPRKKL
jgi:hypothetical protein